ncbi:MAG: ParB/RepB/Spo0J family partition protein [Tidjanibacter sp.]|nr:ParB/RepB/Spo0J family partition protein [Tidjanibacter sp.]
MKINNIGLGRGLGAILDTENVVTQTSDNLKELEINSIMPNPKQPRTNFEEEPLAELAESIKTYGLIQPVTVRKELNGNYIIISGERRWRASQMAGLTKIPAYIREADDQNLHEMALVENIQRQDLNAMEIAISMQRLIDECNITQDTMASRVGKKRSTVANYLRLLSLPIEMQVALKDNLITMGHAKAIASAPDDKRLGILKKCIKKELSVRAVEDLVRKLAQKHEEPEQEQDNELPENYTRLVEQLSKILTEDIVIKSEKDGKGKIIIGFAGDDDINMLLEKIEKLTEK